MNWIENVMLKVSMHKVSMLTKENVRLLIVPMFFQYRQVPYRNLKRHLLGHMVMAPIAKWTYSFFSRSLSALPAAPVFRTVPGGGWDHIPRR